MPCLLHLQVSLVSDQPLPSQLLPVAHFAWSPILRWLLLTLPLPCAPPPPAAEGKDAAVKMFWDGRIKAFHTDRYEAGHRATDYKKWLKAVRPYNIE
jgi:hypothetical protein